MDQNNDKLFGTFPPINTADWEALITNDLKGADYQKKLIWKTSDGFDVKPYYRDEDTQRIGFINSDPGEYPFVRGKMDERPRQQIVSGKSARDICQIMKE